MNKFSLTFISFVFSISGSAAKANRCANIFNDASTVVEELAKLRVDSEQAPDEGQKKMIFKLFERKSEVARNSGVDLSKLPKFIEQLRAQGRIDKDQEEKRRQQAEKNEREYDPTRWVTGEIFEGHQTPVHNLAFSPVGPYLATYGNDSHIIIRNTETGAEVSRPTITDKRKYGTQSLTFSPDGKTAMSTSHSDPDLMLWDVQSGQRLDTLPGKEYSDQVNYLVFNKSGDEFAGNRSGKIYIYKAKTRELVKTLGNENSNSSVTSLTYSPDGRLLLVTSLDGTATVWDVKKNKKVILNGHKNGVLRGSFHPDGQQIVTSSQDGALIFWKITGEEIHRVQVLDPKDENSFLVTFSPDGKKFATLSHDNVAIWDSYSHQKIVDLPPFKTEQYKRFFYMSFGFSQDGKRLYVGDLSGRLGYWEQLE